MRILLLAEDPSNGHAVKGWLESAQFMCDFSQTLDEVLAFAATYTHQITITCLPLQRDPETTVRNLRQGRVDNPILIISPRARASDRITALNAGADLYLTSPVNQEELIAQVRAMVRRTNGHSDNALQFGRLSIDLNAHQARVDDKVLKLSPKEFKVLELLCLRAGKVVTHEAIMEHLYRDADTEPDTKISSVYICKLRKFIEEAGGNPKAIQTLSKQGYLLTRDTPI